MLQWKLKKMPAPAELVQDKKHFQQLSDFVVRHNWWLFIGVPSFLQIQIIEGILLRSLQRQKQQQIHHIQTSNLGGKEKTSHSTSPSVSSKTPNLSPLKKKACQPLLKFQCNCFSRNIRSENSDIRGWVVFCKNPSPPTGKYLINQQFISQCEDNALQELFACLCSDSFISSIQNDAGHWREWKTRG